MTEAPDAEKVGIDIPGNGGDFIRWCCKMATGSGKIIVMAMVIAWQWVREHRHKRMRWIFTQVNAKVNGATINTMVLPATCRVCDVSVGTYGICFTDG